MLTTLSRRISKLKLSRKRSKVVSQTTRYQRLYSDPGFAHFMDILQPSGAFSLPLELRSLIIVNIIQTLSLRQLVELIGMDPGLDSLIARRVSNLKLYTYDGDSIANGGLQLYSTEASCGQRYDIPLSRAQLDRLSDFVSGKGIDLKSVELLSLLLGSTFYTKHGEPITRSCPSPESFLSLLNSTTSIKTSSDQLTADGGKVLPKLDSLTELSLTIGTLLDSPQLCTIIPLLQRLKNLTKLNLYYNRVGYSSKSAMLIANFARSNLDLSVQFYYIENEDDQHLNPSAKLFNDLSPIKGMFKTLKSSMRFMELQWTSMFYNLNELELTGPCDNPQALQRITGSKIKKLTIRLNDSLIDTPLNFDLSALTQLTNLNFYNCQIYEDTFKFLPDTVHTLVLDSCEVSDQLIIPNNVINLTVGPLVPSMKCYSNRVKPLKIHLSCFAIENESLNALNAIFEFMTEIELNLVGFVDYGPIKLSKTTQYYTENFHSISIQNFSAQKSKIPFDNEVSFEPNCLFEVNANPGVSYRELFIAGYSTCLQVLNLKSSNETEFTTSECTGLLKDAFENLNNFDKFSIVGNGVSSIATSDSTPTLTTN